MASLIDLYQMFWIFSTHKKETIDKIAIKVLVLILLSIYCSWHTKFHVKCSLSVRLGLLESELCNVSKSITINRI